jgi:hypothetical protein
MTIVTSQMARTEASWKALPDAPHLQYCAEHRLLAWQPHRVLDDRLLARIDAWLLLTENVSPPCNRFIDFSRLTDIALQIGHVFTVVRRPREKFHGVPPVKCALFCDKPIGFAIARLYETLTESSSIEARAFHDRAAAAKWLQVPPHILSLAGERTPYHRNTARLKHGHYATA